ncbi:MAG TPA: type I glutamate--ammonia ligase [Clostridiales bacterium]|nr:type I glutamate--ammonia ligase [Clostridiales bacterium]
MAKYSKQDIRDIIEKRDIKFLRLQFTDVFGILKNITVMAPSADKVMEEGCMFDGSSIDGFARIEESDMMLMPDIDTFEVFPWSNPKGRTARFICDVFTTDGTPYASCPRGILKRQLKRAAEMGFSLNVGPECEFFLFQRDEKGKPTLDTNDEGGYFDLAPLDTGGGARRDICLALEEMGFQIEAAHHECAAGQHEIDFKYGDALKMADDVMTFKIVVKRIAQTHDLHATFMPKPIYGVAGSGMHINMSLCTDTGNAFCSEQDEWGLSKEAYGFMAGLMRHARGLSLLTNPTVNSYKRLVPGFEAPCYIAWSAKNRSPLVRVPHASGSATRLELRNPDSSANPYLAFAGVLAAGLEGVAEEMTPPPPVDKNIYTLTEEEKSRHNVKRMPQNMLDAIEAFMADPLMKEVLGESAYRKYLKGKQSEWFDYSTDVHEWERERYLTKY